MARGPSGADTHQDPGARYLASFGSLDPDLPLVLLPIRIETRFVGRPKPHELLVRIFPDAVHADGHRPALTDGERELGTAFWRRVWRTGGEPVQRAQAYSWLAERVGPWRAAWVARTLTPVNLDELPAGGSGSPAPTRPRFPAPAEDDGSRPVLARLLPERWAVVPFAHEEPVGTWVGKRIEADLAMAPGLADTGTAADARDLLHRQGLAWTHDVDEAERAGMLVRIDLDALGLTEFDALMVVGIGTDLDRTDLEQLFTAHRYTDGLDLIPQGTPTNATPDTPADWHPDRPDPLLVCAREFDGTAEGPRPAIDSDGDLYRMAGADALSLALGIGTAGALDLAQHMDVADLPRSEAMNRVLWPATWGHYFANPLAGVLDANGQAWLREWATAFVRGGGPLPTLLVGCQPYGVLPVSLVGPLTEPKSNIDQVENTLSALTTHWDSATVPRVDPGEADTAEDMASDSAGDGFAAAAVSQVVGAVPHLTGLWLRDTAAMRDDYTRQYDGDLFSLGLRALAFFDAGGTVYGDVPDNAAYSVYKSLQSGLAASLGPANQVHFLEVARDAYLLPAETHSSSFTQAQLDYLETLGAILRDDLIPLVEAHVPRVQPVRTAMATAQTGTSELMGDSSDPLLYYSIYGEAGTERIWGTPLVAGQSTEEIGALSDFLTDARARAAAGSPSEQGYSTRQPLLRQLVNRAVDEARDGADLLVAGLDGLIQIIATDPEPVATLERLLRESLGVAGYRLDAWYTAVAAWRLENKRARRRSGLHLGAYGFVVDLRPGPARASQGHVLTPSLSLAGTAAVLRSGWAAYGGDPALGGLAVDLSSDRIRRARWLTEGIRQGQDLGELLGSRFERGLHDAGLDRWVRPFRELVLGVLESIEAPSAIVDGLLLARGHAQAPEPTPAEQALADLLPGWLVSADRPRGDPQGVLADLVADFDACADALLAQSVFALVEGNVSQSMASLGSAGGGTVQPPPLRFADSPAPATTIAHRLAVLLDPASPPTWPGGTASGRARAAPGLEAWLERLLGAAEEITFVVEVVRDDGRTDRRIRLSVADTELAALDLLALLPRTGDGLGALGRWLAVRAELTRPLAPGENSYRVDAAGAGSTLGDVAVVAQALRELVSHSTSLDARSFVEAGTADTLDGVDVDEFAARCEAVLDVVTSARDRLKDGLASAGQDRAAALRRALVSLVGLDVPVAYRTAEDGAGLTTQARRLVQILDERLAAVAAMSAEQQEQWPALTERARVQALGERLAALVGQRLPWAPRFRVADAAALAANVARPRLTPGGPAMWLSAAGRVDPGAGRLMAAMDLVEALHDQAMFAFTLCQLPDHPDEPWAAVALPTADQRGRVCLLATGDPCDPTAAMSGLALSTWTEALPISDRTAGLTFHFDAPSTRAPHAVLVCTAKPDQGFSFEDVRAMVWQTLQLAKRRTVGPQSLGGLGQYLPATYLPDDLDPGGQA